MDQTGKKMLENLKVNTGKSLEEWIEIVKKTEMQKHGEILSFLKKNHGFTHGFANLVALKSKGTDAASQEYDDLIQNQYKGKEHFKPLYNALLKKILTFGNDIEIAPKNKYVSLRRKKQFAILNPATKSRFEVGLNIKGAKGDELLKEISKANSMCSHQIDLINDEDLNSEVINWIKKAYESAG